MIIGRRSNPPRYRVLRHLGIIHGDTKLPPGVERKGADGNEWLREVVTEGLVVGTTGCGPCVGLFLIPPPDSGLPTYVFHFGPGASIRWGLIEAGAVQYVPSQFSVGLRALDNYTAVLFGGNNTPGGSGNLAAVIRVLEALGYSIKGYLPTGDA